ncbi:hypothetical protein BKA67DRAFT_584891 [Truncatella angustata]|uniref:Uncharacterized protein n=1 Tax=Truncatella angustata TaxID=152316 RepID=A0A9P8RLA2_9PEZI|nr:uncharacterized protein BKA67DRAFT_584891 [Truncatella angustata]KAH6645390.1 hypothetical protein BKA67DRAFT_584891 [Truncatella angustata]
MPTVSLGKGFMVDVEVFDTFLAKNGLDATEGYRISPNETRAIPNLFKACSVQQELRIFRPSRKGFNNTRHLCMCYDWVDIFAALYIDGVLIWSVPAGLESLMRLSL